MIRAFAGVAVATLLAANSAHADRKPLVNVTSDSHPSAAWLEKHRFNKDTLNALGGLTIYLNQCVGGCAVKPGENDPDTDTSPLVGAATTLPEFTWQTGEWENMVQCVKDVYSPYNVTVTTTRPTGTIYNEVIVAGSSTAIQAQDSCGLADHIGQVGTCEPLVGLVAFAFTGDGCYESYKSSDPDPQGQGSWSMCAVVAQESAHGLGLDHAFGTFDSGQSTCNDPMTYDTSCGGEKFFRNDFAPCNGNDGKQKQCGGANECALKQNSHLQLLKNLGPGTIATSAPVVTMAAPQNGATVKAGTVVIAKAKAQRGVATISLWINGYNWGEMKGTAFGRTGQPEIGYSLAIPAGVPDSKLDIVMKAFDDLGVEGDSATVTAVKGKASGCDASVVNADGTIDTCLKGMQCTAGKCAWTDADTGEFGASCTYPQFCKSGNCNGPDGAAICTHDCDATITDSCPANFECLATNGDNGICYTASSGGGCCSVGNETTGSIAAHAGIAFATLGLLFGIRRKRRA